MAKVQKLSWRNALDLKVRAEYRGPVITNYQLAVELLKLVQDESHAGLPINLPKRPVDRKMLYEARKALMAKGLLAIDRNLPNTVLRFPDRKDAEPAEVLCTVDPFGYIAYLTAMAFHGLTNRLPKILYFITPEPMTWRHLAEDRMYKDLGSLLDHFTAHDLPPLRRSKLTRVDGMVVEEFRTKEPGGGWRHARDGAIRVTTVGRTFLDMLRRADLCGGIRHVMEVFEEHASDNLSGIISELNQHGTKIDRVRAGYILEERCGIKDERVEAWTKDAARGGSRKLDPQADYAPKFSEKWCISLNV